MTKDRLKTITSRANNPYCHYAFCEQPIENQYNRRAFIIVGASTEDHADESFCLVDASEQGFNLNDRNYAIIIVTEGDYHHCLAKMAELILSERLQNQQNDDRISNNCYNSNHTATMPKDCMNLDMTLFLAS